MKQWFCWWGSLSVVFFMLQTSGWAEEFDHTPKLIVKGEASIFKPADQMEVMLGVVTSAENSSQALNENNQRMHQIIANLKALGLDEIDYQTGRFHIRPIYQNPPKDSQEPDYSKIVRYEVINSIQIKTQKIDLADKILAEAVQGGANQVDQIHFNLNNPQSYREEVIKLAAQNALADASALAKATGVRLVRILHLSLDHWQNIPAPIMLSKQPEMRGGGYNVNDQDVLEPGKAEIHAVVNVIFEMGSEKP